MKTLKNFFVLVIIIGSLFSCKKDSTSYYQYSIPEAVNDGWEVCSADEAGISSDIISGMMNHIYDHPGHNIHSILIFKDDKLIFEEYFEGYLYSGNPPGSNGDYISYDRETDHFLASVSKSITSVIILAFDCPLSAG